MKKYISIILVALLFACSTEVDENIAKKKSSELLELIKSHDFAKTNEFYSDEMNASESIKDREEKFLKIEKTAGEATSCEATNRCQNEGHSGTGAGEEDLRDGDGGGDGE